MMVKSQSALRSLLALHQRRLRFGDELQTMTSIADRAGVHRDTLYALINGERVSPRSQYAIDKALREVEQENAGISKTRVMHVGIGPSGPQLGFGVATNPLLSPPGML